MKTVSVICEHCGNNFEKLLKEHNRSLKLDRKEYCSMTCAKSITSNIEHIKKFRNTNILKLNPSNRKDKYSIFRTHLRRAKYRNKFCDLTLEQMKQVWDKQKGICVYSKVKLEPVSENNNPIYTMSLDRIDSSKGYTIDNIQFISVAMNHLKHSMSDKQMLEILNILASVV